MGNGDVSQTQAGFNCSLQDPKSGVLALAERRGRLRSALLGCLGVAWVAGGHPHGPVEVCVACGCDARAPVAERRRPRAAALICAQPLAASDVAYRKSQPPGAGGGATRSLRLAIALSRLVQRRCRRQPPGAR